MTKTQYSQTWDLDMFFEGGSDSEGFASYIEDTHHKMKELEKCVKEWEIPTPTNNANAIIHIVDHVNVTFKQLMESSAFVSCLSAQDVNDKNAGLYRAKLNQLGADLSTILTTFDQKLSQIQENTWNDILNHPTLNKLSFVLNERRNQVKEKLPLEQEALVNDLAVDGYHAWGEMYDTIVGSMSVILDDNGEKKELSVGQAANKLSSSERNTRKEVHDKLQKAWADKEDYFGETLNHLSGFRLQTYKHRGWDNVLKEPLQINRMNEQTLHAMWNAINKHKNIFVHYLQRKASLLGLERLSWYDIGAPISNNENKVSFDNGAEFIEEQFERFGPKMAAFAKRAFEESWIEAEDRSGKQPGGFCTSFPDSKQTRVFMTYSGTPSNVATLAHELGHAFHQHVMDDLEPLNQLYAMNVAETASTFAEMIVADASVKHASNEEERLHLLEDKIQRSVAFFMNIHSRFLFETRFYEERKKGTVSVEKLKQLTEDAQREAYCDSLDEYSPYYWASKLHFHITDVPFYNFPYTFGYLFSLGIYRKALESGRDFEEKYISLLQDTGRMSVEDLATKHLGVDLTDQEFWESAIEICVKDVEEFLRLTENSKKNV
ncbi:M3 family oligoendopeptidase [Pontibacillus yanchengensis]|uniref:M3 family oligoendopeptidase n=2 Tax=Pontibacillus yanchengensis TaxID=462910 RepID=A0ACC7VAI6_9BACI|nr:M3 family oligoendopeptidase [Pontibacillus yanchengensis]MYL51786.1 M3 family oligoendopeptidase [Pontibacillus yanchengensis]